MQPATVAAVLSGDSGCTWSRMAAARVVLPSAIASITSRSTVITSSRVGTLIPLAWSARCQVLWLACLARRSREDRLCAGVAASLGQRATQSGTAVKYSNRGALSEPQHHSRDRLMCVNDFSKPHCREFTPKRSLVRSQYRPPHV